ncbi:TylF/MycF/NovP-related O-methyltransferase [Paenibacillus elgii]|uniref:TylF/MycF/NovP-related O-methyltransferase n=1 Tax=Paenibacillus elgii TaxID=189691 RepID=UPI000248C3F0|nr:TylF/MycF/NovP-related O-methyltransferase [Paenibacillus elgii]
MYKLMLFGTGGLCSYITDCINYDKAEIVAYINSNVAENGNFYNGRVVISPSEIHEYEYDYIIIASGSYDRMVDQLTTFNITRDKIIGLEVNTSNEFYKIQNEVNHQLNDIFNTHKFDLFSNVNIEPSFLCNTTRLGRNRSIDLVSTEVDYVRLSTLELVAAEIHSRKTEGNVAELGVYKGQFSQYINKLFSDRKLYLFDTFEGFNQKDVELDVARRFSFNHNGQFLDTNTDIVLKKMSNPEQCIIRKGFFPETAVGTEDVFAFVSIDTDLFNPIYEGLSYFYPRLAQGGYIFVHDFNNGIYKGAKHAVKQFCAENKISYVPLSDQGGTAVITK